MTIGKPFQKGRSGNPGGRPKVVAEVKELARKHTGKAIETLVSHDQHPPFQFGRCSPTPLRSGGRLQQLSCKLIELKANHYRVTESRLTRAHSRDAQD